MAAMQARATLSETVGTEVHRGLPPTLVIQLQALCKRGEVPAAAERLRALNDAVHAREQLVKRLTLHHVRSCNRPTSRIVWTRRTRNGLGRSKRPHVDACEVHAVLHRRGWQSWRRQSRSPAAQCWWWHAATYAATSPIAQQTPRYVRPCRLGTRRETEEPHGLRYEG